MRCHLFRDYVRAQSGSHGQESSKEKKAASGSKSHSSHKATIGSDISIHPDCFPITEPGVTLSRSLKAKMLLFILKCFALYQENNKWLFCYFSFHQKYRHDPCGCTTLLRTMVEMEGWHLSSFLTQIFGPTSPVTQHGLHKEPIHILLDFRKSFQMSWLNLFIITIWPLSWHEFNLVYNSLIWLSSLNKWRKLSHW